MRRASATVHGVVFDILVRSVGHAPAVGQPSRLSTAFCLGFPSPLPSPEALVRPAGKTPGPCHPAFPPAPRARRRGERCLYRPALPSVILFARSPSVSCISEVTFVLLAQFRSRNLVPQ